MSKWYDVSCVDCGTVIHAHEDWDSPPKRCPSFKDANADDIYHVLCAECGTQIVARHSWEHPPKFCQSCKKKRADEWYEKSCEKCGTTMRIRRDWSKPPDICKACKQHRSVTKYMRQCRNCTHYQTKDWSIWNSECKLRHETPDGGYAKACSDFSEQFTIGMETKYCDDCARYNPWKFGTSCEKGYGIPKSKHACEEFESK
jgi:hypothetical protein